MELGTGLIKSASSAQKTGSKMLMENVFQFLINALLMLPTVTVPLATKDMTSSMENVSSLNRTMLTPQILDVVFGTGMLRSV